MQDSNQLLEDEAKYQVANVSQLCQKARMIQRNRIFASLSLLVGAVAACSNPAETTDTTEAAAPVPTLPLYSSRH